MIYANNTYNYTNPEYSAALSLAVDKNLIQYGNTFIAVDSISSVTVSHVRSSVPPIIKKIAGICLLIFAVFFLKNGYSKCKVNDIPVIETIIVDSYDEVEDYINSRAQNANWSFDEDKFIGYIFVSIVPIVLGIMALISRNKSLYYLVLTLYSGKEIYFCCENSDFLQNSLSTINTMIKEKTSNIYYAINFKECRIVKCTGNINNIQGNNNTIGG